MKFGENRPDRITTIEALINGPKPKTTESISITDYDNEAFPKYKVDIWLPKYRIQNTRTLAHQIEYMNASGNMELFDDPESDISQQGQHEILKEMLDEEGLFNFFKEGTKQQNALIMTRDGFVISGNRRLSCWRELYFSDIKKYQHLSSIDVCFLEHPNNSPEIDKIEALQETGKSIQSKFGWFQMAMKFQEILNAFGEDPTIGYTRIIRLYQNSEYITKKLDKGRIEDVNRWIDIADKAKKMMIDDKVSLEFILKSKLVFEAWFDCQLKEDKDIKVVDYDIFDKIAHDIVLVDPKVTKIRNKHHAIQDISKHYKKLKTKLIDQHELLVHHHPEAEILKVLNRDSVKDNIEKVIEHIDIIKFNENNKNKREIAKNNIIKAQQFLKEGEDNLTIDSKIDGVEDRIKQINIHINRIKSKIKSFGHR
ncbi:MAG: hypothetical protein HQ521_19590 [Bacteroidetes bacterium]|nr:hypothetical protein [Bacteroidota bacterium]